MKENLEQDFIKLLDEHQNIMHKICRIYTDNLEEHNDLCQEITIQLWQAYKTFKGNSKFSTWAYRVGLNTAISLYRRSSKKVKTTSIDIGNNHYKYTEYRYDVHLHLINI